MIKKQPGKATSYAFSTLLLLMSSGAFAGDANAPIICSTWQAHDLPNCRSVPTDTGSVRRLEFDLEATIGDLFLHEPNGGDDVHIRNAFRYNGQLLPEILVLRRGDELEVNYSNHIDSAKANALEVDSANTNLHTHGFVTPWDYTDDQGIRGDNVLGVLAKPDAPKHRVHYLYPIGTHHPLGLNWFHPHPHGHTGIQVQGGMSGLIQVADEAHERGAAHSKYVVLKDLQSEVLADNSYAFRKFEPDTAPLCSEVDATASPASCRYAFDYPESTGQGRWFFTVNGELSPRIDVSRRQLLRISNNGANLTYRLALLPNGVDELNDGDAFYYPKFHVTEKDGVMAASDLPDANQDKCVLTLTPATRTGAIIAFEPGINPTAYCKGVKSLDAGTGLVVYALNQPMLAGDDPVAALAGVDRFELFQAGIQTNEDPWPAIRGLATFVVDHNAPISTRPPGSAPAVEAMMGATGIPDSFAQHVQPADPKTATCTHEDRYVGLWFLPGLGKKWPEAFGLVVKPDKASIESLRMSIQELLAVDPDTDPMNYKSQLQNLRKKLIGTAQFNMNRVDLCANQDPRAEHWHVFNLSHQLHNFHIHQLKFGVDAILSSSCAGDMHDLFLNTSATDDPGDCEKVANEVFRDVPTVSLPLPPAAGGDMTIAAAPADIARGRKPPKFGVHDTFPVPPMGRIDIRIAFDSIEKTGNYVFHCHILEHEDAGMMAQIAVQSSTVH